MEVLIFYKNEKILSFIIIFYKKMKKIDNIFMFSAIRIYNYNKNKEDIYRGVKKIRIFMDNQALTPENGIFHDFDLKYLKKIGIILKKASGVNILDYGQTIEIPFKSNWDLEKAEKLNQKKEKMFPFLFGCVR